MRKTSIKLQELRRKLYLKAKAEPEHRFWGLYVHVCKMETLQTAYGLVRASAGAPGIDGETFQDIEKEGLQSFLENIQAALQEKSYYPEKNRIKEIPKTNGKIRRLGIPTIRDRVVQAALKLIMEPIFEAGFQDGSYGYRPKKTAHEAIASVGQAVVTGKTRVIDLDLKTYFDTVRHHILLGKIAERIEDDEILWLLKKILKGGGKLGLPQGSVISPLLANIYLNEVDKMLAKAKEVSKNRGHYNMEYARFADDVCILVSNHPANEQLWKQLERRLREELAKLEVQINEEKTKFLNMEQGDTFSFLGFTFRRYKTLKGKWSVLKMPKKEAVQKLRTNLKTIFRKHVSQPLTWIRDKINPILRGWANYFRIGNSATVFSKLRYWLDKKIRRHLMRAQKRKGFGWERWSTKGLFAVYNIYSDFKIIHQKAGPGTNRV